MPPATGVERTTNHVPPTGGFSGNPRPLGIVPKAVQWSPVGAPRHACSS